MRPTDISPSVRRVVYERDSFDGQPCCVYCGRPDGIQIAHYVSRGRGGKGVPENLVCLCYECHSIMDNGSNLKESREIKDYVREYLKAYYEPRGGWDEKSLVVDKWSWTK